MKLDDGSRPVLVTGAQGFIGRPLIQRLIDQGETVVAFDATPQPVAEQDDSQGRLIAWQGDIRQPDDLKRAIETHGAGSIVHLAALLIPACQENPVLGTEVNVIGHINVLEAARAQSIDKVVYASSIAARPRPPLNAPPTLYGVFKHCDEEISQVYFRDYGLVTVGLRPVILYGPGRESGQTAAITMAMKAAAQGEPFTIPFRERTCFQHVDETVEIFVRCLAAAPDAPVISDMAADMQSTDDVADAIHSVVPGARIDVADVSRAGPPDLDDAPLEDLLGSWTKIPLEEGVRRTIEHYRTVPAP
jgi:nucleoside-diphosphate-sugar epimerase